MMSIYAATKVYMNKLTEALRMEYADSGVIVQMVNPGQVVTNMNKDLKPSLLVTA